MTAFPELAAHEPQPWTPPALRELPDAPVFLVRPPPRGARDLRYALTAAGLVFHGPVAHREEAAKALRELWPPEQVDDGLARLREFWATLDRGEKLAPADSAALDELSTRLRAAWPRIGRMAADDAEFIEAAPRIAAGLVIAGWSGIDVAYRRDAGRVPLATIDQVERALVELEGTAGLEPGAAFVELTAEAFAIINGPADAPAPDPTHETDTAAAPPSPKPARRRSPKGN